MAEKQKLLVLSEDLEDTKNLTEVYDSDGGFATTLVYKASEALSSLLKDPTDLLVFNVNEFTSKKLDSVLELRNIGIDFPVLTLASQMDEKAHMNVSKVEQALLLAKPYNEEELLMLTHKMAENADNVIQRRFQRFKTGQSAFIKKPASGVPIEAEVCNISKTGAKLALPKKSNINQDDLLKIQFNLNEIDKHYDLFSQVVWVDKKARPDQVMIGIKYISETLFLKKMAG